MFRTQYGVSAGKPISVVRGRDGKLRIKFSPSERANISDWIHTKHIIKNWTFEIDTKRGSNKQRHEYKIDGSGRNDT
jgi:hypothetical protein